MARVYNSEGAKDDAVHTRRLELPITAQSMQKGQRITSVRLKQSIDRSRIAFSLNSGHAALGYQTDGPNIWIAAAGGMPMGLPNHGAISGDGTTSHDELQSCIQNCVQEASPA